MLARENPFRSENLAQIRYQFEPDFSLAELLTRLETLNGRGALVGPEGRGKSTLMQELGEHFEQQGRPVSRFRLTRETPRFDVFAKKRLAEGFRQEDVLLLDGGEVLSPLAWWRFRWQTRKAGVLLMTAHREGYLPTLHSCSSSPEMLRQLLEEFPPLPVNVESLFAQHEGNVREVFRALYFHCAELAEMKKDGSELVAREFP